MLSRPFCPFSNLNTQVLTFSVYHQPSLTCPTRRDPLFCADSLKSNPNFPVAPLSLYHFIALSIYKKFPKAPFFLICCGSFEEPRWSQDFTPWRDHEYLSMMDSSQKALSWNSGGRRRPLDGSTGSLCFHCGDSLFVRPVLFAFGVGICFKSQISLLFQLLSSQQDWPSWAIRVVPVSTCPSMDLHNISSHSLFFLKLLSPKMSLLQLYEKINKTGFGCPTPHNRNSSPACHSMEVFNSVSLVCLFTQPTSQAILIPTEGFFAAFCFSVAGFTDFSQ